METGARARGIFGLLKTSFKDFSDDDCPRMAAALSYYTVFALPPLLILIVLIVGMVFDPQEVERAIVSQTRGMGGAGAEIGAIVRQGENPAAGRGLTAVLGIGALLLGATGAFMQLQAALNRAWEVEPDKTKGGIKSFIFKRLLSLGMVLTIAFLLLVSLVLSSVLTAMGGMLQDALPWFSGVVARVLNILFSLAMITVLFALIFKVLPDARIAWRDVWVGALATAFLFVIGKELLGLYLGRSNPGEAFGAAGSLAVLLVWIYYSSMIVLFGAEFTQTWAVERGSGIEPEEGARRMADETPAELDDEGSAAGGKSASTTKSSGPREPSSTTTTSGAGGTSDTAVAPGSGGQNDAVAAARTARERANRRAS